MMVMRMIVGVIMIKEMLILITATKECTLRTEIVAVVVAVVVVVKKTVHEVVQEIVKEEEEVGVILLIIPVN